MQGVEEARQYDSSAGQALARKEALPTIHAGLHFVDVVDEYGLPIFINTLIWEDYHRGFKKDVYTTNHSNVERLLLDKVNFRMTIRLLLLGAFDDTETDLTALIRNVQRTCPSLFQTLLPRSEVEAFNITEVDDDADDDDDDIQKTQQVVQADAKHLRPRVIGRIQPQHVKSQYNLPTSPTNLSNEWRTAMRDGYEVYGEPNLRGFGTQPMKWCKKVSFYDP